MNPQKPLIHPPVVQSRINEMVNRQLTKEELEEGDLGDITPDEREETLALVRWFTRRYPTPGARLAYVRRAYQRWTAGRRTE